MDALIKCIVDWLLGNGIIQENNIEIYNFGLRQSAIHAVNLLTFLIISLSFGMFWPVSIFLASYMVLRPYAGGYHAETQRGCYIASTSMIVIVAYIQKNCHLNPYAMMVGLLIASSMIWFLGPVEDHHKPLDAIEVELYREKMRGYLFIEWIVIGVSSLLCINFITQAAIIAIDAVGLMVLLGWLKNRSAGIRKAV